MMNRIDTSQRRLQQQKNFTLEELLELFHDIESAKDGMLGADPHLERSMTVCQNIEYMLALYGYLYKKSTIQTTLHKFFLRNGTLISHCF